MTQPPNSELLQNLISALQASAVRLGQSGDSEAASLVSQVQQLAATFQAIANSSGNGSSGSTSTISPATLHWNLQQQSSSVQSIVQQIQSGVVTLQQSTTVSGLSSAGKSAVVQCASSLTASSQQLQLLASTLQQGSSATISATTVQEVLDGLAEFFGTPSNMINAAVLQLVTGLTNAVNSLIPLAQDVTELEPILNVISCLLSIPAGLLEVFGDPIEELVCFLIHIGESAA